MNPSNLWSGKIFDGSFRGMIFNEGDAPSRHAVVLALSCLLVFPSLGACGSSGSGMTVDAGPKGNVVLYDVNNYTSTSTLTIPSVQTQPGVDLDVCWSTLSKDILCHALTPANIDSLTFLKVLGTTDEAVEKKLANGSLSNGDLVFPRSYTVDHAAGTTCTKLSSFALGMTSVDPAQDYTASTDKKYLLLFQKGVTLGAGARTMLFVQPTTGSTVTRVDAQASSCDILHFSADVTTPTPLAAPIAGPWVVDWSQITKDSMGVKPNFQGIDSLMLGFYQGKTVDYLQTNFLDIDTIATTTYTVAIPKGAKTVDLAGAKDASGVAFPGFTQTDGVWALALLCSTCQVPAPVALTIIHPM